MKNRTVIHEFILLGLTNDSRQQPFLFICFLLLYLACLLGNGTILAVIVAEPRLQTPMYFFLGNLSCLDLCFSTVSMPTMLNGFLVEHQTIPFIGCLAQMHFFHFLGGSEAMILAVMAYDRYVAICKPLHYSTIMSKHACLWLAAVMWSAAFCHALMHTVVISQLSFCGPNLVLHFFCDIKPLLQLSCSSTALDILLLNVVTGGIALSCFIIILLSYLYIVTFLFFKFRTWESRWKAFSTCASHLTVVAICLIPVMLNYMLSSAGDSFIREMIISVLYSAVTPVLNPLIYTLRNQEVKSSIKKIISKNLHSERTGIRTPFSPVFHH